jgi:DnaK suppressor protein
VKAPVKKKSTAVKKPVVKAKAAPAKKVAAKPVAKPSKSPAKPASKAKPVSKPAAKPAAKVPVKTVAKAVAKAAAKPVAKPSAKAPAKSAVKTAAKAVAKPIPKTAAKTAPKPSAVKSKVTIKAPVTKTAAKPAPKPAAKPAAKPAVKAPAAKAPAAKAPVVSKAPAKSPAKPAAKAAAPVKAAAPAKTAAPAPKVVAAPVPVPLAPPKPFKSSKSGYNSPANIAPKAMEVSTAAKTNFTMSSPVLVPVIQLVVKKDAKLVNNWKTRTAAELTDAEAIAMPDSEYMSALQMAFFRLKLVQLKKDILSNAGETTEHLREDTSVVPDPADRATIEEEHALELRTRDRERKLLKKIEQSISRIDADDYGFCDETGEAIGVARLIARPTATLSLEAQQRRELKQKMFGD